MEKNIDSRHRGSIQTMVMCIRDGHYTSIDGTGSHGYYLAEEVILDRDLPKSICAGFWRCLNSKMCFLVFIRVGVR
jgi:hypothetical protein